MSEPLSFSTRVWFAFVCWVRVLTDGEFATRAFAAREALPEPDDHDRLIPPTRRVVAPEPSPPSVPRPDTTALQLLGLFQEHARFIDFLEEDIASAPDADIGAAARLVHAGCRKVLRDHVTIEPIRDEAEGASVTLPDRYDAVANKLTGNVRGAGPFTGTLRHKGWRAKEVRLPILLTGADPHVLASAEVEV